MQTFLRVSAKHRLLRLASSAVYLYSMNTNEHVSASRAVGAEFLRRKLRSITTLASGAAIVLSGLSIWLVTISAWWWILLVIVVAWAVLGIILLAVAWLSTRLLRPDMTTVQKKAVSNFVDKIERVSETLQTAPFMIFFKVLRDMIFPSQQPYIRQLANDSTSLHTDYIALTKLFKHP